MIGPYERPYETQSRKPSSPGISSTDIQHKPHIVHVRSLYMHVCVYRDIDIYVYVYMILLWRLRTANRSFKIESTTGGVLTASHRSGMAPSG